MNNYSIPRCNIYTTDCLTDYCIEQICYSNTKMPIQRLLYYSVNNLLIIYIVQGVLFTFNSLTYSDVTEGPKTLRCGGGGTVIWGLWL